MPTGTLSLAGRRELVLSRGATRFRALLGSLGRGLLLAITSASALAVLFIFYFIFKDALPFFQLRGAKEFFTSTQWYPSAETPAFGALAIFVGSALVTAGAIFVAVPLGVPAAVCLSDVLPFKVRQVVKPVIEILAAIPSVAYGFFALVLLAPLLQEKGGRLLEIGAWVIGVPMVGLVTLLVSEWGGARLPAKTKNIGRIVLLVGLGLAGLAGLAHVGSVLRHLAISSGTNALNVSIVIGVMALPTVVSVSEDALQAVGRELREGSYALGATRAETIVRVVLPAASGGICAGVILGVMRAIGETMVVWMASGNAAHIPTPWYNLLEPVRTMTATIAGDMGEADQVTGSARYHVLFALALCLLVFCYTCNLITEWIVRRQAKKLRGE